MTKHDAEEFRAVRSALVAFAVAVAGAVLFMVVYALHGNTQWLGIGLTLAFGGIGYGFVTWAHRLMPPGGEVEERELMYDPAEQQHAAAEYFEERAGGIKRRTLLGGALATALGALGVGALFPLRSLGPRPDDTLRRTDYANATRPRLITKDGVPIHVDDLPVGGLATAFPEGYPGSASGETALIRLDPSQVELRPPTRTDWVVEGYIAYSKQCTHAGCAVGEYQVDFHTLFCPCHQSSFRVLEGGQPISGPAARPLPQLPLGKDEEGYLVALGDFSAPVGPGWWTRP